MALLAVSRLSLLESKAPLARQKAMSTRMFDPVQDTALTSTDMATLVRLVEASDAKWQLRRTESGTILVMALTPVAPLCSPTP